ncbi:MAG TPA: hypothetical protein VE869_10160 [Gemmatimonas sp.]|nr:hypothetical protein [Gemmatimonas sp.]
MTAYRAGPMSPSHFLLATLLASGTSLACTTVDRSTTDSTVAQESTVAEAAAATATATAAPAAWHMRPDGVEGVRIGMTTAEARTALGLPAAPPLAVGTCEFIPTETLPKRLYLMAVSDTLVRIDVRDSTVVTVEGARVGSSEAQIRSIYGSAVRVEPHKYTGPVGHYMKIAAPGSSTLMIVFETDGARVTTYRVGRKPVVEWVEGCS